MPNKPRNVVLVNPPSYCLRRHPPIFIPFALQPHFSLFPTSLCGVLTFGAAPADRPPTDRRPTTDRPTDRPTDLLLAPPLSFFYTHTRHTHVDSLTHTRQTHTRSLTVPFAHGARAGASLDTHTVDAHTFAHGARARLTLDTHSALQALDGARARFGAPPP